MADQNAAAEPVEQPTPADSSAQETGVTQAPGENWEDRAKEHQAWGTRLAQENAELRAEADLVKALRSDDPAEQRKALEALGYQVPDDDETLEPDSQLYSQQDPRIDELMQWRESLTTEQQQEQHYSSYRGEVDPQLTKLGVPEAFVESVADIAYNQLPAIQTPQGPAPDLEGAVKQFKELQALVAAIPEVQQMAVEEWRKGKKNAPHVSPVGTAGTQTPNLDDRDTRRAWMAEQLMANEQQ